jgi:serine protease Do
MKTCIMKKTRIFMSILVLVALACQACDSNSVVTPTPSTPEPSSSTPSSTPSSPPSGTPPIKIDRGHLLLSTVEVFMEKKQGSDFEPFANGSGTIISADGLILTNAHVASPASQGDTASEPDRLTIAVTQSEDRPPVLSYVAEVRAVDGALDLAVLQIVSTLNGSAVNKSDLKLPFVPLGNSDNVHIGDHLNIFGFPGVGKDTVTYTDGSVAGFTAETPPGERAWIKTAINIAHGNSGGLAADDQGEIIGVPTTGEGDCNQADTNGDGRIDTCIPNGNAINYLRPVNFAVPLIQAAQAGKEYASTYHVPGVISEDGTGKEALSHLVWLDASLIQNSCKASVDIVDTYSADALCIMAGFNYSGMTDGEPFRELWLNNGKTAGEFMYSWEDGAKGSIGTSLANGGDPIPQGKYTVEFYAGADLHKVGQTPQIVVGDAGGGNLTPPIQPSQDTVSLYGVISDADTNKPLSDAYVFVLSGVTYEEWQNANYAEKYITTSAKTDNAGKYKIPDIPRGKPFTFVFSAKGHYDAFVNNVAASPNDPDLIEVNIGLTK